MRSLHLIKVSLYKELASIVADMADVTALDAMTLGGDLLQEIATIVKENDCTIHYRMEVTFNPNNVRLFLNIYGQNPHKPLSTILKNA